MFLVEGEFHRNTRAAQGLLIAIFFILLFFLTRHANDACCNYDLCIKPDFDEVFRYILINEQFSTDCMSGKEVH